MPLTEATTEICAAEKAEQLSKLTSKQLRFVLPADQSVEDVQLQIPCSFLKDGKTCDGGGYLKATREHGLYKATQSGVEGICLKHS